ncbi:S1/P1 nuclease-domain-containing protein [Gorgonomyces haynaldii]|nr:S1/P1 nuclease-domain-containing protein [Gorgonomyces haynaldii]
MLYLISFSASVSAWGPNGHSLVGNMAHTMLSPTAKQAVSQLINTTTLGAVANWADDVKKTDPFKWSANLHFVSVLDRPPEQCMFMESRDCPNATCINGAIANFTKQACSSDKETATNALQFLVHFFGDIVQPLHNSNNSLGGNLVNVTYNGNITNLHKIWDIDIPDARAKEFGSQADYQAHLLDEIEDGEFKDAYKWVSKYKHDAVSSFGNSLVANDYTIDSNSFDCSYVYKQLPKPDVELNGTYTSEAGWIIDRQMVKGAVRLAHHLNQIFDNCKPSGYPSPTGSPTSTDYPTTTGSGYPTMPPIYSGATQSFALLGFLALFMQ